MTTKLNFFASSLAVIFVDFKSFYNISFSLILNIPNLTPLFLFIRKILESIKIFQTWHQFTKAS